MSSSGQFQSTFHNTCVPIEYRCNVGDTYIDPCDCTLFYRCASPFQIISRPCGPGTGFNHENNQCDRLEELVADKLCDLDRPWKRCSDVDDYDDVNELALQRRCTSGGGGGDGGGRVDGGLIAGVVIAVLIVAVIVVALIIYVRKRGNPVRHLKDSRVWRSITSKDRDRGQGHASGQPSTARYGVGPEDEETYAEIDDTAAYKDPSGGKKVHTQLSHSNETYDKEGVVGECVAYDNPALRLEEETESFPPLPAPPPDADPPTYSPLEDRDPAIGSYSSLSEHTAGTGPPGRDYSKQLHTGDDGYLMAEAIGEGTPRNSSPLDPNYFVLEKS